MKLKLLFLSLISTNAIASIDLKTEMQDVYGQTGTAVYITCYSTVSIQNLTSNSMKYLLGTKLCAQNKGCIDHKSDLSLASGKVFNNTYSTVFTPTFNRTGKKDLTCTNYVSGDEGRTEVKRGYAYVS